MITQPIVKELFDYLNGKLIRKTKTSNKTYVGDVACCKRSDGYFYVSYNNKRYLSHRVIFLWHHGFLPQMIDHIDQNCSNNKIENLRPATTSQNCANSKKSKNNTSGYKGVCWDKQTNKWMAHIRVNYKRKTIGRFNSPEEAHAAYCQEAKKHFGEFAHIAS